MNTWPIQGGFKLGPWKVLPRRDCLIQDSRTVRIEPKAMQVLVYLAERQDEAVTRDELMEAVWLDTIVSDETINRSISVLRKALEDDFRRPIFIETLPKTGYRLLISPVPIPRIPSTPGALISAVEQTLESPAAGDGFSDRAELARLKPSTEQPRDGAGQWKTIFLSCLAAAFVLVSAGSWLIPDDQVVPLQKISRHYPLTSLAGLEIDPAISPNGNILAYVWGSIGDGYRFSIYLKRLDSGEVTKVTDDSSDSFGPAWSPDGQRIAYTRFTDSGCVIATSDIRGGREEILTTCLKNSWADPVWSKDGKHLIFSDFDPALNRTRLFDLRLDSREVQAISLPPAGGFGDTDPAVSPDGGQIAFNRRGAGASHDIYVMNTSGGEATRLTFRNSPLEGLAWSSDGAFVIFAAGAEDSHGLWRVPAEGGTLSRLPGGTTGLRNPSISSDGNRLVGERWMYDVNIWKLSLKGGAAANGLPEKIISSTRHDSDPHFSPDGSQIVFASNRSGRPEIWVTGSDGDGQLRLTNLEAAFVGHPRWSPDGNQIVFEVQMDGNLDLYVTDRRGGLPRRLTDHQAVDTTPRWSLDGRFIYFASDRSGASQIWKISIDTGTAEPVTQNGGTMAVESSDGKWLYLSRPSDSGIWRRSLSDNHLEHVMDLSGARFKRWWTLCDDGIYFTHDMDNLRTISFFSFHSRKAVALATPMHSAGLSLSPDGSSLIYSQNDQSESDVIVLEG